MIDRTITSLNLLIGAFVAGAVVCVIGIIAPWVGHPLTSADLMPVFLAVALLVSATRINRQIGAEFDRERVRLQGDRLRNDRVAAELASRQNTPAVTPGSPVANASAEQGAELDHYATAAHWGVFWRLLAQAGTAYGFTQAALTTENTPTKVMSEPAWNATIPMFVASGWLSGGKPGRATKWATGRGLALFEEVEGWKALPCPDSEPPEIALPPYTAVRNNTTTVTTSKVVIDGIAKRA